MDLSSPHRERTAQKATALGLVPEENSLSEILKVAMRIAGVVEGERTALTFPALLMAYYLVHFPQTSQEVKNPELLGQAITRLVWFAEEGTVQLAQMLQEIEKIEDGITERRAVN